MDHWQEVLDEVMQKPIEPTIPVVQVKKPKHYKGSHYYLGEHYNNVYLTSREAQCVYHMLQGCTIKDTAKHLSLSPRTVEFYVKNMRLKVNAVSKSELLEMLMRTNLPQELEEEMRSAEA
ncbi:MAG: helix-turn-helix transcriptional regulator [Gammaproteobacteria bacterium]|nr:helix-turn-helix transcriptional regulator [Gammaproteobacteria bacterium]MCH9744559.1 helix-turn-helix transcriptional regulator [Gammaproteobacteria bacterium]